MCSTLQLLIWTFNQKLEFEILSIKSTKKSSKSVSQKGVVSLKDENIKTFSIKNQLKGVLEFKNSARTPDPLVK